MITPDEVSAAGIRRRRDRARIPDEVRHTEKWRLALQMIDEMTGPGGWGVAGQVTAAGGARPVVVADAGYGDNTIFRLELAAAAGSTWSQSRGPPARMRATRSRCRPPAGAGPAGRPGPPISARR